MVLIFTHSWQKFLWMGVALIFRCYHSQGGSQLHFGEGDRPVQLVLKQEVDFGDGAENGGADAEETNVKHSLVAVLFVTTEDMQQEADERRYVRSEFDVQYLFLHLDGDDDDVEQKDYRCL
mmetsp:Transcript_22699/g.36764  ORF Transcript_22699/g.36764 Transcript_22699/m.36764 type:complete len:121 (+) Transcript_22699:67-429(+)